MRDAVAHGACAEHRNGLDRINGHEASGFKKDVEEVKET
jgi:hypothetical protein